MLQDKMRIFAYPFGGYWVDVGTLDSYWLAHMDLLHFPPLFDLADRSWIIHTKSEERPPVLVQKGATVVDSLICDGSVIAPGARVERSVLSPGVYVGPEAVVIESILFTDCSIEAGARVERSVVDKFVTVGHQARVGRADPGAATIGVSAIGKNSQIPSGGQVGRACQLGPDIPADRFPRQGIPDGKVVDRKDL
jgi:glucose-1-phosphate adenylyltransferase